MVLVDGEPAVFVERGGKSLVTFPGHPRAGPLARGPASPWPRTARSGRLEIARVDGDPVGESPEVADRLKDAGFTDGYKGLTFRP